MIDYSLMFSSVQRKQDTNKVLKQELHTHLVKLILSGKRLRYAAYELSERKRPDAVPRTNTPAQNRVQSLRPPFPSSPPPSPLSLCFPPSLPPFLSLSLHLPG